MTTVLSIDQNSHPLWDAAAKVAALTRQGRAVLHLVEDVDVAFTCLGCRPGDPLRVVRERYHHSGGADWGAALFYSGFLGRLPLDVRDLEPYAGLKLAALARSLGRTVESLYDQFSPGDNWQLVGPSYAGDEDHHRVIADLAVDQTAPFLREILALACQDTLDRFPAAACQARTRDWFAAQQALLDELIAGHQGGKLVALYADWMARTVPAPQGPQIGLASSLGRLDGPGGPAGSDLLDLFLRHYDRAAGLYNQALAEGAPFVRPLRTGEGELPFFALLEEAGQVCRTGVYLEGEGLRVGGRQFRLGPGRSLPLEAMREAGIWCVMGKAVLLVIQVRLGPRGRALALPHHGSVYVPAAHAFTRKLAVAGLLAPPEHPILRVRLRLLDRLGELDCPLRLPPHLSQAFGREEVSSRDLAGNWRRLAAEADARLSAMRDPAGRAAWQREAFAGLQAELDQVDQRRRELARVDPKAEQIRHLSHRSRQIQARLLEHTLLQAAGDWQVRQLEYWDSRGAVLPWAHAAGGERFVQHVLDQAEVVEERP